MKTDRIPAWMRMIAFSATIGVSSAVCANDQQVADLEAEIAALKEKLAETGSAGEEIAKLVSNIESSEKEIAAIKESALAKETELAGKEYLLGVYQGAYRVTTTLSPGENLGAMTLKNGETVEPSSFVSIGKGEILVQSATGSRSIPVAMLPDSFAGRVSMPPAVASPNTTVAALQAGKPDSLKSAAEKTAAASTAAPAASEGGAASAPANDHEAIRKRNDERLRQITELKIRFSALFTQKKVARQEKANAERLFREAKIKRSQAEVSSTMKIHNDKISAIEKEEASIREQITRLQSQME